MRWFALTALLVPACASQQAGLLSPGDAESPPPASSSPLAPGSQMSEPFADVSASLDDVAWLGFEIEPDPDDEDDEDDSGDGIIEPLGCRGPVTASSELPDRVYGHQWWSSGEFGSFDLATGAFTLVAEVGTTGAHINNLDGSYNWRDHTVTYGSRDAAIVVADAVTGDVVHEFPMSGRSHLFFQYDGLTDRHMAIRYQLGKIEVVALDMRTGTVEVLSTIEGPNLPIQSTSGFDCERREYVFLTSERGSGARTVWIFDADDGTLLSSEPCPRCLLASLEHDPTLDIWLSEASIDGHLRIAEFNPRTGELTQRNEATHRYSGNWSWYDFDRRLVWNTCQGPQDHSVCAIDLETGERVIEVAVPGLPHAFLPPRP